MGLLMSVRDRWHALVHADVVALREWECYEVPGPIAGEPWFEAQGSLSRFRGDPDQDAWLHGTSPGAVLDKALAEFPDEQHEMLVSHGTGQHLCPEARLRGEW